MENNDNLENEFNKVRNSIFYFDWNIYSYLSNLSALSPDMEKTKYCFSIILDSFIDLSKTCIPYSVFHYRDIILGDESFFDDKIKTLLKYTNGWNVKEYPDNKELLQYNKSSDMLTEFNHYRTNAEFSDKPLSNLKQLLEILMHKPLENDVFADIRDKLIKIISDDNEPAGLSILKFNKVMRNANLKVNNAKIQYPVVSHEQYNNTPDIQGLVEKTLKESDIDFSLVMKQFDSFKILSSSIVSNFTSEIMRLSFICDFIGLSNEKLSKKTSFEAQINDLSHLSLALRMPFFVTEDKTLAMKANFIKKWMKLPVKIFNMDSFITTVLSQVYKEDLMKGNLIFKFMDNNELVKEYSLQKSS